MSCICQFVSSSTTSMNAATENNENTPPVPNPDNGSAAGNQQEPFAPWKTAISDDAKITAGVSEVVRCRADNWLLKKKLDEYEVNIQSLEQLMTTIVNKQNENLSEIFELRLRNEELQTECLLQRQYHAMERDALIKEIHFLKTLKREPQAEEDEDEESNRSAVSEDYEYRSSNTDDTDESRRNEDDDEEQEQQMAMQQPRIEGQQMGLETDEEEHETFDDDDDDDDDDDEEYEELNEVSDSEEGVDQSGASSPGSTSQSSHVPNDTETSELESEEEDLKYLFAAKRETFN